jgi:hypothetical protein
VEVSALRSIQHAFDSQIASASSPPSASKTSNPALCTLAAMNLSTEDSSSTNHIAIIFDCLYRFLKYGSSAQVRYVGGFFAAFVPSGLPAVLCGEWQAHEGRAQWREILLLSFKHAQHQNASSVSRRRDERSETLLDDGVERRVVRRKRHAPLDLDF